MYEASFEIVQLRCEYCEYEGEDLLTPMLQSLNNFQKGSLDEKDS